MQDLKELLEIVSRRQLVAAPPRAPAAGRAAAYAPAARANPRVRRCCCRAGNTSTAATSRRRGRRTMSRCRRTRTIRTATTSAGNATSCRACTTKPWWSSRRLSKSTRVVQVRVCARFAEPASFDALAALLSAADRSDQSLCTAGDYYGRGDCYRHQGKLDEAMAEYSQALKLDPKFAGACWGRGDCLLAQVRDLAPFAARCCSLV